MDDIEEALPHAQKAIRKLTEDNHIASVTRQQDKKVIVFYRPKGRYLLSRPMASFGQRSL